YVTKEWVAIEYAVKDNLRPKIPVHQAVELRASNIRSGLECVTYYALNVCVRELESIVDSLLREMKYVDSDRTERRNLKLSDRSGTPGFKNAVAVPIHKASRRAEDKRASIDLVESQPCSTVRESEFICRCAVQL